MKSKSLCRLTLVSVLGLSLCFSAQARAEVVGAWLFDEGSGETITDSSGNGLTGTIGGNTQWVTEADAMFGTALRFEDGDYIDFGPPTPPALLIERDISFTVWCKPHQVLSHWQVVFSMQRGGSGGEAYAMTYGNGDDQLRVILNTAGGNVQVVDPEPFVLDEWIHAAATYDGDTVILYRNAEPVAEDSGTASGALSHEDGTGRFAINGNYNSLNGGLREHTDSTLDEVVIFDEVLDQEEIQSIMELGFVGWSGPQPKARRPDPADGGMIDQTAALLKWLPGDFAVLHDVYFGTEADAVTGATPDDADLYLGRQAIAQLALGTPGAAMPEGLTPGATYYWRVDEVNDANAASPWKGDVWSFRVRPEIAWNPIPADGMKFVDPDQDLIWESGIGALVHTVYIGTDPDEISSATAGGAMTSKLTHEPGTLEPDTTYYWRVDELQFPQNVTHKGQVWSFTTLGAGGGVKAEYFAGVELAGEPLLTQIEDAIDHEWGDGAVVGELTDQVSARWTADLEAPLTDTFSLITTSDDGVRLWLDGALIINNWTNHSSTDDTATVDLTAGEIYSIRMEWYEDGGGAVAQLSWSGPSVPRQIIPGGALQPPLRAGMPSPANGAVDTPQTVTLSWSAGDGATGHHLYFGDDAETIANAAAPTVQLPLATTTYDAGALQWGKSYYWRVDETQADGSVIVGKVWRFTTADFLTVDDFESYSNEVGRRVFEVWIDGIGFTQPEPGNPGNGTGAAVGHDIWSSDSPHFEGTIMETDNVHGGLQAMPMYYDNTATPWYSQAERTWAAAQNWTVNGLDTLSLQIRGVGDNDATQPPYVTLVDSAGRRATVNHPDATVLTATRWTEWNILLTDFAGVQPTAVKEMTIGVGNPNAPAPDGAGEVYIDTVRVIKSVP